MFAFLRVIVFYLGFAALLIWGIFALGLADVLELPGFEGSRAPVAITPTPVAVRSAPEPNKTEPNKTEPNRIEPTKPEIGQPAPVARPVPPEQPSQPRDAARVEPRPEPRVESRVETRPDAKPEQSAPPKRVVVDVPQPAAPPVRTEVAVAPPVVQPPRPVEQPKIVPPSPSPPPPPRLETKAPEPVAKPAPPATPAPPRVADAAPVRPPPAAAATPTPPSQTRAPAPAATAAKSWAPVHRIAGFGASALAEHLADKRRARDDIACVMFRNVVFKGGTTAYRPSARADLEQVAKILNANPGQRVELGSRLGPGRPMVTDAKLRTDRAELVRQSLISLGVAPARLAIDTSEAYERVAEDVGRVNGGRIQSMGVCVLTS